MNATKRRQRATAKARQQRQERSTRPACPAHRVIHQYHYKSVGRVSPGITRTAKTFQSQEVSPPASALTGDRQ